MRGRRRLSAGESVFQDQTRMSLKKQVLKDAGDVPSGSQQMDENTQEDEALDDRDDNDELSSSLLPTSSSRDKRKRERGKKSKPKEMTEEEMMDLALRLSEQEASVTALRLQKEEEAIMKAIQESMVSQTQPCAPSQSQSLLDDAEAPFRIGSRRKLLYSNGRPISQGALEDGCTAETDLHRGSKRSGDENNDPIKKRKRKEGSPLQEMPDLSQTQRIYSQASPCSSEILELHLDSPQSCDSTQIDDCQLRKSPVFPLTGCRAEVQVHRLSQDLLQTCRSSGFVLCSQDSSISPPESSSAQPKSPTFSKSPEHSSKFMTVRKSPVLSETDQDDGGETEISVEYFKSPVFGKSTQHQKSPSASKPQASDCNSGFMFSSQESLTSSVRSASCRPTSPVFPKSPVAPSRDRSAARRSPVFSETGGGQTEQRHAVCTSPVFGRTGQEIHLDEQKQSRTEAAELSGSDEEKTSNINKAESLRQNNKTDLSLHVGCSESFKSDDAEEQLKDKDSAEMELTSDMTLIWSDEDEDVTPVGSPSPVFPEEKPDGPAASQNHRTAASPQTTESSCRPSSPSTSTGKQQLSTTEQETQPISSQGAVSRTSALAAEPAGGSTGRSTVHYYWGVPFCPRGLDPDSYTKVILAQMEVYEKSLKQAQRCLLRKAEWGEAVLPQPEKSPSPESPAASPQQVFRRRRGLRLKSKKLCDDGESPPAEEATEEEEGAGDNKDEEEREGKENKTERKNGRKEGGQVETDDCEVCPETQLSDNDDDRTQDLTMDTDAGAELQPKSPEQPEVEMIPQDESPARDEPQKEEEEEMEVEVDDIKTKGNMPVRGSDVGEQHERKEVEVEEEENGGDPDVEEIKDRGLQRSTSPELELAVVPRSPETSVTCPICQGSFPLTEIEMHAAYCDGEVEERRPEADCFQVSLKPRRKRTRRAEVAAEENDSSSSVKNQEKCFLCQKTVPLRDYSKHTELCIQRQTSRNTAKGNLLSALEKTDSRDSEAGPSGSRLQPPGDVIDLRDDDDDDDDDDDEEEGGVSALRISDSPIRSFTPISEATDCLIDFKKQHRSKRLSQRRR